MNIPKFVATSQLNIAYLDSVHGDKTCLLIHGWPDDALTWSRVSEGLESSGVRCVRPYLRGFGPTTFRDATSSRSGQLVAMALDLIDFIEALDLKGFVLVGHDWGARISYMLATQLPERLLGMVCLSVGYGTNSPAQELSFDQARMYWYHWYFATALGQRALARDPKAFAKRLWEVWSPYRLGDEEWEATAESFTNPDWVDVTLHSYRHRWGEVDGDPAYDDAEVFFGEPHRLSTPTIVLHGDADGATLPKMSEGKEMFFTGAYERRVIPEAGHFIQREQPQLVVDAVLRQFH